MVRTCHLDTCPVGIATQRPGAPRAVRGHAGDGRGVHASGRTGGPRAARVSGPPFARRRRSAVSTCSARARSTRPRASSTSGRSFAGRSESAVPSPPMPSSARVGARRPAVRRRPGRRSATARTWSSTSPSRTATAPSGRDSAEQIGRTFGMVAPPGSVRARFHGAAGQSFGAFLADGIELRLTGEANDYVGKGMGGGRIVDRAHRPTTPASRGSPATRCCTARPAESSSSPAAPASGSPCGTRVRWPWSRAWDDHACEYMTGGTVVVLGPVGRNLAAGMTGGELFVHDPHHHVPIRLNPELVEAKAASAGALERLHLLVRRHHELTGSVRAAALLAEWDRRAGEMVHVRPRPDLATIVGVQEGTRATATQVRDVSARPLRSVGTS